MSRDRLLQRKLLNRTHLLDFVLNHFILVYYQIAILLTLQFDP